jgi:hypothetical protein
METKKLAALAEDIKFLDKVFEKLPASRKSGLNKEMNSKEVKKYFEDLIDA